MNASPHPSVPNPLASHPLAKSATPFHVMTKPIGPICNLDCTYCYYLEKEELYPETRSFRMQPRVLLEYIRQYIESQPPMVKEVNFAWQGGEPTLLGLEFFHEAMELQKRFTPAGMSVRNAIQTNGTLLNEAWCSFFREHEILVGISIDGPEDLHDAYRLDKKGDGTWGKVMQGLKLLKRHQVEFNTLSVVNRVTAPHPARVYDFLKSTGSRYFQFIPVVEYKAESGVSHESVPSEDFGKFLKGVFFRWVEKDVGAIFVQHFDLMLGLVMGYPSSLCVHARTCGKALALEHNGDLYSCDHFVDPEYRLGNILETPIAEMVNSARQDAFGVAKSAALPRYCRECEFLELCHGGCPAHRVIKTPDGEEGLNHLCAGYKIFYGQTLPHFSAMADALRSGLEAREYHRFLPPKAKLKPERKPDPKPKRAKR